MAQRVLLVVNPSSTLRRLVRSAAIVSAGALVVLVTVAAAQDAGEQEGSAEPAAEQLPAAQQPSVPSGQDVAEGVFVRDSSAAVDQFALAERMERLGEWAKAADVYQEVLGTYGGHLIADRTDAEGKVYQYASVARAVQRKLAAWPAEGRAVYEQKFGAAARARLAEASAAQPPDLEALQDVVRLYFITDAARQAGLALIDRQLADGQFAAAQRVARELLEAHPALGEDRPRILLRAAVAAHFLGDAESAAEHAEALAADFPQAVETVAGAQRPLADVAREILAAPLPQRARSSGAVWPVFAGGDDRARLAAPLSGQIAPYVQDIRLPQSLPAAVSAEMRRSFENARRQGQLTGIFPVAYEGALYWHDNVHVFAVALDSGLPLSGWLETYGPGAGGGELPAYTLPGGGFITPRGVACTPTVTDRFVLANLGLRDQALYLSSGNPAIGAAQMVCLDRHTGRQVWVRQPGELEAQLLEDPALQADLAECQFVGAPLVVGDTVWTLARTDPMRGRQFEQAFLVSLELETGTTRTITYLASSSRDGGGGGRWQQRAAMPEPASLIAYSDGLIYAPTDTGALAAVRVADGGVEWLNLYPRNEIDPLRRRRLGNPRLRGRNDSQPFHVSPVIVESGRVFFKPPDAAAVFVWDASDGSELARVPIDELDGDRTLLKVIGSRLLSFGSRGITCLDWTKVRDGAAPKDAIVWTRAIALQGQNETIAGRPAVTEAQVLVPTPVNLWNIQLSDGYMPSTYPSGGAAWAETEGPGNVVVLEDQLVIATSQRLNIYADSEVIRERLLKQVAENPADPAPLLRLAQIAFVGGEFDGVVERVRQAEQAAANMPGPAEAAAAQSAVFAGALNFALTLQERLDNPLAPGNPTVATVDRFFALAQKQARTPAQHVRLRFAQAAFADTEGGAERRVALLQEILADAAWRQVPTVPGAAPGARGGGLRIAEDAAGEATSSPRQAGEVARELIAQVIRQAGAVAYAPVEARAGEELRQAIADVDVAALRRVAEVYPNSAAGEQALSEAARLLREQNRTREAVATLRQLASRSREPLAHWLALAQIDATRAGRLDAAAGRLRRAARIAPDAPAGSFALPDGERLDGLSIEQAAFRLTEQALAADAARVPDLGISPDSMQPAFAEEAIAVDGVEAMLVPLEGFGRHDRIVVRQSDGTLAVYAFASAEPVWSAQVEAAMAEQAAWVQEGLLVWGPASVTLFDADTGQPKWQHATEELAADRLLAGQGREGAVVAPGWSPTAVSPEAEDAAAAAEARLREAELDERTARMIMRRQQMQQQQQRAQALAQARREPPPGVAGMPQDAPQIAGVVPSAGSVAVLIAGKMNSAAGIATDGGEVRWRAALPEGVVAAAHGAGDYLAVQTEAGRTTLSVLDGDDGTLVARRHFEPEGADPLVNFLLTPENELVFVTRRQLTAVDLDADPRGARFTVQEGDIGEHPMPFGVSSGPGRLTVVGGKLLVLADPLQAARRDAIVIDLARGKAETFDDQATQDQLPLLLTVAESSPEARDPGELPPRVRQQQQMRLQQRQREALRAIVEAGPPGERLWTAGTSVYLTADRGLAAYDLAVPGQHWSRLNAPEVRLFDPAIVLSVAIGRDHVLLFDEPQPTPRRPIERPTMRMTLFSRERLPGGRESGLPRAEVELSAGTFGLSGPVQSVQPASGGVAVLAEGGRLLFLRGGAAR